MCIRESRLLEKVQFVGFGAKSTTLFFDVKWEKLSVFFWMGLEENIRIGVRKGAKKALF